VPLDQHSQLLAGDHVLVITPTVSREATERRIRAINKGGKLARWYGREPLADDRAIPLRRRRAVPEHGVGPRQVGPR
jgi:potassium/hydrogen antiporter